MPDKNRSHGKIDGLPDDIRKEVENKLLEGYTYEVISSYLKDLGHDVHYSSVHRFGKPFLKKFENVRMAKEFAQLLAEDNAERPSTELHEANNALASQMLMEILVDEDMEQKEKIKTLKSIASLQQAQVQNERLKILSRKEAGAVKTAMNILRVKVFEKIGNEYPDVAKIIMGIADEVEQENSTV